MTSNSFVRFLYRLVIKLFRVEVIGAHLEPQDAGDRGILVCANHISLLDPIIIVSALNNKTKFMAKKELFKVPIINIIIKWFGAFPVNRGSADVSAMRTAINILGKPDFVGMFPQGTRYRSVSPDKTNVKNGAGMLIGRAKCDFLPLAIITKGNKFRLFRKIYLVVGEPVRFDEIGFGEKNKEEFQRVSQIVFDKILELYKANCHLTEAK